MTGSSFRTMLLSAWVGALSLQGCAGCARSPVGESEAEGERDGDPADDSDPDAPPPDGGPTDGDDPLEQPIEAFCQGTGAAVTVGAGNTCTGNVAAEVFQFAFCACETFSGASVVTTDSFDSRLGPHDAASNVGTDGNVGVNGGLSDQQLHIGGSLWVGGGDLAFPSGGNFIDNDLYTFGNVTTQNSVPVGRDAFVSGNVAGRLEVAGTLHQPAGATTGAQVTAGAEEDVDVPRVLPCACESPPLVVTDVTDFGATHNDNALFGDAADAGTPDPSALDPELWATAGAGPGTLELPCGRYYLSGVNQTQPITLVVTGRVALMVGGDFLANNGISIETRDGGEIDLFVAGDLAVSSAATFGDPNHPAAVRTYVGGDSVSLQASAGFGGNLYAPNALADFGAQAEFYGSLFVKNVEFGAQTTIHFDSAIRSASDACDAPDEPNDGGTTEPDEGGACTDNFDCGQGVCNATTETCEPCTGDFQCSAPAFCDAESGVCIIG